MINAQFSMLNVQRRCCGIGFSFLLLVFFSSCSVQKKINKSAKDDVLNAPALQTAHVGISIYEPATGKYWYDYNGEKYFVPASNVKIPTCYVAMKYLGDSLVGLRYENVNDYVLIEPTGDPTFLHPDFSKQMVYEFLKATNASIVLNISAWQDQRWGSGWSWSDYNEEYMAERSIMPMYGNVVWFTGPLNKLDSYPSFFSKNILRDSSEDWNLYISAVQREIASNSFAVNGKNDKQTKIKVPFYTDNGNVIYELLSDTLDKEIIRDAAHRQVWNFAARKIYSQLTDSVLKPMMHRSDNFFAEQLLLMVSNERLGIMNDEKIIDTLLKTDLNDLPKKPRWVDGSGLSRYNLFTPKDLVIILNKMKNEFGMERIKNIFPTGGQGTLSNYYLTDSNYIYAKTGTLSGVVALSGYLYTRKGKELIFSILVNNHEASGTDVRRAVEKFLRGVRNKY